MQISCSTSNVYLLVLAPIDHSFLTPLLRLWLPNGDFSKSNSSSTLFFCGKEELSLPTIDQIHMDQCVFFFFLQQIIIYIVLICFDAYIASLVNSSHFQLHFKNLIFQNLCPVHSGRIGSLLPCMPLYYVLSSLYIFLLGLNVAFFFHITLCTFNYKESA